MPRPLLALGVSVALHAAAAGAIAGVAMWRGWSLASHVDFELVATSIEDVKDIPLGPPPPPGGRPRQRGSAAHRTPKEKIAAGGTATLHVPVSDAGTQADAGAAGADAGEADVPGTDSGKAKPSDLRSYGPEGSRLTALLRLDRLRTATRGPAFMAIADDLLQRLPDRHLIDGTSVDLFRDFDSVLIATPNPMDEAVTFLAVRHHLKDEDLRTALDKNAAASGRSITWTQQGERPVGLRAVKKARPGALTARARDDRIFVLPAPGLAVIAPAAYARLLLPDAKSGADAGAGAESTRWRDLAARIDDHDGVLPTGAVLMVTAANLLSGSGLAPGRVVPGTRGAVDDDPGADPLSALKTAGLPDNVSLVVGLDPSAYIQIKAEFAGEDAARVWHDHWPALQRQAMGHPLLMLAGLVPIVGNIAEWREGETLTLRTSTTTEEALRLFQMLAAFASGRGGFP